MDLKSYIRDIPDFPKEGIIFKDITTLLKDHKAFKYAINQMADHYKEKEINKIVGPESRGFIFGTALAFQLGIPFIPIRKPGKLPSETESEEYELEYGKDKIEIHKDSIEKNEKVLIVDDLLATGGTALASAKLVKKVGGDACGFCFLIELSFLKGREKLYEYDSRLDVYSLIYYESEKI